MTVRFLPWIAAAVSLSCISCSSWKELQPAPDVLARAPQAKHRIWDQQKYPAFVRDVRIEGDTLFGTTVGTASRPPEPAAFPLTTVKKIERRQFSPGKTALVVFGIPAAGFLVAVGLFALGGGAGD